MVGGLDAFSYRVIAWKNEDFVIFGADLILASNTLCSPNTNVGYLFWWVNENSCFTNDIVADTVMGPVYYGVKSYQPLTSYYLSQKGIYFYFRNTTDNRGNISRVTGDLFDHLDSSHYPIFCRLESDEKGTIFLIDGFNGEIFWMKENNLSFW